MMVLELEFRKGILKFPLCSLSAFDMEREREWRQRENALKVQIAQLEATLKADVGEKGSILDKLTEEKGNLVFCAKATMDCYQ